MSDPSLALRQALLAALTAGSPALTVYDAVPQDAAYPYVTLDFEQILDRSYVAKNRDERFLYLSVWSTYKGQKEVLEIMAEIHALLDGRRLTLAVGHVEHCQVVRRVTRREPDNETYQGQVTLRLLTQHG